MGHVFKIMIKEMMDMGKKIWGKRNDILPISPIVLTYLTWIVIHCIATNIYVRFCAGNTLPTFIASLFYTSSSYCQGLSWTIYTLSQKFTTIWVTIGSYLSAKFLLEKL